MTTKKIAKKQKRRWATTPTMRAGVHTAYDALAWVVKQIKQERRRLDMNMWLITFRGKPFDRYTPLPRRQPACGTVACFCGWINVGTRNIEVNPRNMGDQDAREVIFGRRHDSPNTGLHADLARIFTHENNKTVLPAIAAYMKRYETELKAHTFRVPTRAEIKQGIGPVHIDNEVIA